MMDDNSVKYRVFVEGQAVGDVWHHGDATARAVSRTILESDALAREAAELGLDVCFVRMVRDGRSWQTVGEKRRLSGPLGRSGR